MSHLGYLCQSPTRSHYVRLRCPKRYGEVISQPSSLQSRARRCVFGKKLRARGGFRPSCHGCTSLPSGVMRRAGLAHGAGGSRWSAAHAVVASWPLVPCSEKICGAPGRRRRRRGDDWPAHTADGRRARPPRISLPHTRGRRPRAVGRPPRRDDGRRAGVAAAERAREPERPPNAPLSTQ